MIRPDPKVIKAVALAVRQYPEILNYLEEWRMHELEMLPNAINSPAVSQGRCQVLGELYRFAKDAPSIAAKI
jgi:hypothetical protein